MNVQEIGLVEDYTVVYIDVFALQLVRPGTIYVTFQLLDPA